MTGGIVVETNGDHDHIEIVVEDAGEQLALKVEVTPDSRHILKGDVVWWQGRKAYWTSMDKRKLDIAIPRVGFSYTPRKECPACGGATSEHSDGKAEVCAK